MTNELVKELAYSIETDERTHDIITAFTVIKTNELAKELAYSIETDERTHDIITAFMVISNLQVSDSMEKAKNVLDILTDEQKAGIKDESDLVAYIYQTLEHGDYLLDTEDYEKKEEEGEDLSNYLWSDPLDKYVQVK